MKQSKLIYSNEQSFIQNLISNLKDHGFFSISSNDEISADLKSAEDYKTGYSFSFVPSEEEILSYKKGIEPSIELIFVTEKSGKRHINGIKCIDGKTEIPEGWHQFVGWTSKDALKGYIEYIKR